MFIYEGNKLAIIKKDDDIWFRGKKSTKSKINEKQSSIMLILKINAH